MNILSQIKIENSAKEKICSTCLKPHSEVKREKNYGMCDPCLKESEYDDHLLEKAILNNERFISLNV